MTETRQLIAEFKVGGVIYGVYLDSRLESEFGAMGMCDYANTEIRLSTNQSSDRMQQTLIHELTHAMMFEAGYEDHDEELVNRLSIVLYQVLGDNFRPIGAGEDETAAASSENDPEMEAPKSNHVHPVGYLRGTNEVSDDIRPDGRTGGGEDE